MTDLSADVIKDANLFESPLGLAIGSLLLIAIWVILKLTKKYFKGVALLLTDAVEKPLLLGFSTALYVGFLLNLLEKLLGAKLPIESTAISTSFVQVSFGWASINVSRALLFKSKRIKNFIPGDSAKDQAMLLSLLERLLTIIVVIATLASLMVTFGVSTAAVGALLGGAGIGIGFGTQQISQNFLSGFMLFFNRPFAEGDWIITSNIEGTVERIGWYHTRIRTFDRRPLYIPNSVFATSAIENPGRMYNRRIKASISLRYEDLSRIERITKNVKSMLIKHSLIDKEQIILVNFNEWDNSSINMLVYCFTKTTSWKEWLDIQQDVFLQIATIVKEEGGDFAYDCTTLYPSPGLNIDKLFTS
tara:strand:+ start:183 stop:1265 length:1083 start_codon:yes stop_codon:yes gene_type:complete